MTARPAGPGNPRVVVIIPAVDEEQSIGRVIAEIPRDRVHAVIVVDNGSRDQTARVAGAAGATVVQEPRRGYGSACLAGIETAKRLAPDILVFLDGDYSDYPEQMSLLLDPIVHGEADMVIGSRMRGVREVGAMLPQARFGNWLASKLMSWGWDGRFTDLGPFRAIRMDSLVRLGMADTNYGWTIEMQIKALEAGLRCQEVPVDYRPRIGQSKVTGTVWGTIRASEKILRVIGTYWLSRGRRSYD